MTDREKASGRVGEPRRDQSAQAVPDEKPALQIGDPQVRFDRTPLVDQVGAQHAGKQPQGQRRGEQLAVALDEDIAPAAFGDEARLIDEHDLGRAALVPCDIINVRSEEHTSELQSLMRISYAVFCLKKK